MKVPGKIIVVIVLLLLAIAVDTIAQLKRDGLEAGYVIGVVVRALLIVGLLKGSEGVRMVLKAFAFIGLFFSGMALVMLLIASGRGAPPMAFVAAILGVISNGFVVYALMDQGVQAWMFSKSMGGADETN